jgi:integrase
MSQPPRLLDQVRQVIRLKHFSAKDDIERAKCPEKIPVVFTQSEVKAILAHLNGVHHFMAILLCGAGLRLNECLRLRVKDLDFES